MERRLVGFVIQNRKGKFLPRIGECLPNFAGDVDTLVNVVGQKPGKETLEDALQEFEGDGALGLERVFKTPVNSDGVWMPIYLEWLEKRERS